MSNAVWTGQGRRIFLQEVGTRDGLQAEATFVPTADKVALVEVTSPVGASGRVYHNTLYDENATIHIAFGQSITAAYSGAGAMSREARETVGLNQSDDHLDLMIGTPTMGVTGIRADGSEIAVMVDGRFAPEMLVSG